jgi:quinol monooxygenase YgiN
MTDPARAASTASLLPVFVAKPGRGAELLDRLVALRRASLADQGCIAYRLFRDEENPDRFVLVEEWSDAGALEAHNEQPHVARFVAESRDLLVEPFVVTRLAPVA